MDKQNSALMWLIDLLVGKAPEQTAAARDRLQVAVERSEAAKEDAAKVSEELRIAKAEEKEALDNLDIAMRELARRIEGGG